MRPEDLLELQRSFGNQAVLSLLAARRPAAYRESTSLPVQRKRTDRPSPPVLIKVGSRADLKQNLKDTPEDRARELWAQMQEIYSKSVVKGKDNWGKLQSALDSYADSRLNMIMTLEGKRISGEYDERYKKYYRTELKREKKSGLFTASTVGGLSKSERKAAKVAYMNHFDPKAGLIRAASNFADKDKARAGKKGLPNSEILWQQHLDAVQKAHGVKRSKARVLAGQISQITREQVVNLEGRIVVFMVYPTGDNVWTSTEKWLPVDEDFLALLGTPNVTAVVHLLLDHMDEIGGKTIDAIITTTNETIEVHLGSGGGRSAPVLEKELVSS